MRFTLASISSSALLLASVASASPKGPPPLPQTENVGVYAGTFNYDGRGGASVEAFRVHTGKGDIFCLEQQPRFPNPSESTTCDNFNYSFAVHPGPNKNTLRLRLYHMIVEDGPAYWGQTYIPLSCNGNECAMAGVGTIDVVLHLGNPPDFP